MTTPDEIEADRLERLAKLDRESTDDPDWHLRFAPGSFGCHEALHTTSLLQAVVEEHLVDHPAILLDPELFALAARAAETLADLYLAIGHRQGMRDAAEREETAVGLE